MGKKIIGGLRQIEGKESSSPVMNKDYQRKGMRKVGHMKRMGDVVSMYKISSVYLKGREHLEYESQFGGHNWKSYFYNRILSASTFSKLCKNLYSGV
jgi:hypothetical protein